MARAATCSTTPTCTSTVPTACAHPQHPLAAMQATQSVRGTALRASRPSQRAAAGRQAVRVCAGKTPDGPKLAIAGITRVWALWGLWSLLVALGSARSWFVGACRPPHRPTRCGLVPGGVLGAVPPLGACRWGPSAAAAAATPPAQG